MLSAVLQVLRLVLEESRPDGAHVTLLVLGTTTSSATAAVAILVLYEAYWRFSFGPWDIYIERRTKVGNKNRKRRFFDMEVMLNECKDQADRNERGKESEIDLEREKMI
jgi:hypothetical protein